MKLLVIVGLLLIMLGLVSLIHGGITYTREKQSAEIGPLEFTVTRKETFHIHPVIGAAVVTAGTLMVVFGFRKRA